MKIRLHISILLLAVACSGFGCATDRVGLDITTYLNEGVLTISELEEKSLARYASVTGENYKNDQELQEALQDQVIPLYKRFVRGLRAIRPETEEVKALHRIYIEGADSLLEGFKLVLLTVEKQDASILRSANDHLASGVRDTERWKKELLALSGKHKVKILGKEEAENPLLDTLLRSP